MLLVHRAVLVFQENKDPLEYLEVQDHQARQANLDTRALKENKEPRVILELMVYVAHRVRFVM